jgi:hypothetical protein
VPIPAHKRGAINRSTRPRGIQHASLIQVVRFAGHLLYKAASINRFSIATG